VSTHMVGVLSRIEASLPSLRRYASTLLDSQEDADNLVRGTLLRALETLHAQPDEADVRAWLFGILHDLSVSKAWRARRRSTGGPLEQGAGIRQGEQADEAKHCLELMDGVDRLPERERTVVLLVSVEDLTYAEVSRVLGIPVGTVLALLAGGRERLRQLTHAQAIPCLRRVK
jgi:RNA polymerase sigma factor (sigma-70 family)